MLGQTFFRAVADPKNKAQVEGSKNVPEAFKEARRVGKDPEGLFQGQK